MPPELLQLLLILVGLALFFYPKSGPNWKEVGRITFFAALLTFLLGFSGHMRL